MLGQRALADEAAVERSAGRRRAGRRPSTAGGSRRGRAARSGRADAARRRTSARRRRQPALEAQSRRAPPSPAIRSPSSPSSALRRRLLADDRAVRRGRRSGRRARSISSRSSEISSTPSPAAAARASMPWTVSVGADVEPARRRGRDERRPASPASSRASDHLLRVAAREQPRGGGRGPGARMSYALDHRVRGVVAGARPRTNGGRAIGSPAVARRTRFSATGRLGARPVAHPVLGHVGDARRAIAAARVARGDPPAGDRDRPGGGAARRAIASASSRWPLPATPGDAEDLAGDARSARRRGAPADRGRGARRPRSASAARPRGRRPPPRRAAAVTGAGRSPETSRPTISRGEPAGRGPARRTVADGPAAAQDRDAVGHRHDLVELVRDEDDGLALGRHPPHGANSRSASCGVRTAVGSSRIRTRASR